MKKIYFILALAAFLIGCTKEETNFIPDSYTIKGYTNTLTKTDFGTPDDNSIPFMWSEGDKIWSGSIKSSAAEISSDGVATFTFNSEPSGNIYYNMTGPSGSSAWIPVLQDASKTLGENGDFGYATMQNGSFSLNHETAYLWFDIQSLPSGAILESIRIHAGNDIIAGAATFNGTNFTITDGRSIIELKTNISAPTTGADAVMVVYPGPIHNAVVTYQFKIGPATKYYEQNLSTKTLAAGNTYKIVADLTGVTLKEYVLRTLTFEDNHTMFDGYSLDYASKDITLWSSLIDEQQHGGMLLYSTDYMTAEYKWNDVNNTYISHTFPFNWGGYSYSGGGYALSNYTASIDDINNLVQNDPFNTMAPYQHQLSIPLDNGHSGDNFIIGYHDSLVGSEVKNEFSFSDGKARVIDHLYITNSSVTLYAMTYGFFTCTAYDSDDFLTVTIEGFDGNTSKGTIQFNLATGSTYKLTDWQKLELHSLGNVTGITITLSEYQTNDYGYTDENGNSMIYYSSPLYFAIDDIAIRF